VGGFACRGRIRVLGIVDELIYPGTRHSLRFEYPSSPRAEVQARVTELTRRLMEGIGFDHGFFNVEPIYRRESGALKIIEVNPRLASQLADLYQRGDGINPFRMLLDLATGVGPRWRPGAGDEMAGQPPLHHPQPGGQGPPRPAGALLDGVPPACPGGAMTHQPPPLRTLELLWWAFLASALLIPLAVGLLLEPAGDPPPWSETLFLAGLAASLPAWLVKRHFDARLADPAFRALPDGDRLGTVQQAMILGLAAAELPMYAGVGHYLFSGQVIGITILTLISLALMLLFHPSRILRAR
jgi:hypothetical protein